MRKRNFIISLAYVAIFFIISIFIGTGYTYTQVAINNIGNNPHPSSMLDIDVSGMNPKAGLLIPRMTTAERDAIPSPAAGLLIYNTTTNQINFYNGTNWRRFYDVLSSSTVASGVGLGIGVAINHTGTAPHHSAILDVQSSTQGLLLPRTTTGSITNPIAGLLIYSTVANCISFYDGTIWQTPCNEGNAVAPAGIQTLGGIAINTTGASPHHSAILDVSATNAGLLLPRVTSAERDLLPSPAQGLIIYNSTDNRIEFFNGSHWRRFIANMTNGCLTVGGASFDEGSSIIQTSDGGYVVAGNTYSFGAGAYDCYIVKLDACNNLQWTRTVGGTGTEYGGSIVQTSDGGYAVAGYTTSFGAGGGDCYIVKLNASGVVEWTRTVGGANYDHANSIIQTSDGGYAVAGNTNSFGAGTGDFYIVKLNASGVVEWTRTVGGGALDYSFSIVQTSDGGYAVAGYTSSFGAGNSDFYIVKLNASGVVEWTRTVGGGGNDYAYSIVQTNDDGYVVGGTTFSFGAGNSDFYIVKLNSSGNLQWTRTIGGSMSDNAYSIVQASDGGYVMVGTTTSFGAGSGDIYIVKLNSSGNLQWTRTIGGAGVEYAGSIFHTSDGGYAVAGYTTSFGMGGRDVYIVKLKSDGTICNTNCNSGSGGTLGSPGGNSGTGGIISSGGTSGSGGTSSSGGTLIVQCSQ